MSEEGEKTTEITGDGRPSCLCLLQVDFEEGFWKGRNGLMDSEEVGVDVHRKGSCKGSRTQSWVKR